MLPLCISGKTDFCFCFATFHFPPLSSGWAVKTEQGRFCLWEASISTAAGGELLQNSPITHTSVLRSSYRLQALLTEECIKMKRMCYLKLSSENMFFFWTKEWNNSFAKLHSAPFNVLQQPSWSTTKRISGSNEVFKLHYHLWLVEEANLESSHMPVIDIR